MDTSQKNFNVGVIHPIIKDEHGDLRSNNNIRPKQYQMCYVTYLKNIY